MSPSSSEKSSSSKQNSQLGGNLRRELASVPETAEKGNLIVIFGGCGVPFVIRTWLEYFAEAIRNKSNSNRLPSFNPSSPREVDERSNRIR
jgi:hypothetical protein